MWYNLSNHVENDFYQVRLAIVAGKLPSERGIKMDPISLNAVGAQAPAASLSKKIDAVTIKPTSDSTNQQNAANEANSYYKYDSMELSREYVGYRMKSENATVNSDTEQLNSTVDQKADRVNQDEDDNVDKKTPKRQLIEEEEPEDDAVSGSQLRGYSSSELKGLVLSGKITVAEYNNEVKNRQAETKATEPVEAFQLPQPAKVDLSQFTRKRSNSIF